jgi:hypothetical protein
VPQPTTLQAYVTEQVKEINKKRKKKRQIFTLPEIPAVVHSETKISTSLDRE